MNLSLFHFFISRELRKNWLFYLKIYGILGFILGIVLINQSVVVVTDYSYRYLYLYPQSDDVIIFYGNITFDNSSLLFNSEYIRDIVYVTESGLFVKDSSESSYVDVLFVSNMEEAGKLLPYGEHLLEKGSYKDGCAVVSNYIARKYDLDIGKKITLIIDNETLSYTVSGILYDLLSSPVVVVDINQYLPELRKEMGEIFISEAYIKYNNLNSRVKYLNYLNKSIGSNSYRIISLNEMYNEAKKTSLGPLLGSWIYYLIYYGSIMILVLLFLRESLISLRKRSYVYGLFILFGLSKKDIILYFLIELILLMLGVTTLGFVIVELFYFLILNKVLPLLIYLVIYGYSLIFSFIGILLSISAVFYRIYTTNIKELVESR